jgi:hypothetical protein
MFQQSHKFQSMQRECPICKNPYEADPGRLKFGRQTTCSRKCSYELRRKAITKQVTLICAVCCSSFTRRPSGVKSKHAICCSKECKNKAVTLGLIPHKVTSPYQYTTESKARMVEASRKPKGKRFSHPLICTNCGKDFEDPNWGRARKSGKTFCSVSCCNTYRSGANNPAWRGGHPKYYGSNWRVVRRQARVRDDFTCQRCGKKRRRLPDVHHIQPINTFNTLEAANFLENLVCLCHNCHMFVEWHGMDFRPKTVHQKANHKAASGFERKPSHVTAYPTYPPKFLKTSTPRPAPNERKPTCTFRLKSRT